jgi:transposase InsO family protein
MSTSRTTLRIFTRNGIRRLYTTPYTLQQNEVAERKNKTILNMVRSMMKTEHAKRVLDRRCVMHSIYAKSMSSPNTREQDTARVLDWTQAECGTSKDFREYGICTCSRSKEDQTRR